MKNFMEPPAEKPDPPPPPPQFRIGGGVPDMPNPPPPPPPPVFRRSPNPTFLEKQIAALLKALMKKDGNHILQMVIEQQHQILELSKKIGELTERDTLRERQLRKLYWEVKANGR